MRKMIIALLCFMLLSTNTFAVSNEAIFEVTSLGIVKGDKNGDLNLNKTVTRSEFAEIASRLMGCGEVAEGMSAVKNFTDIDKNHPARSYISFVEQMGIMSGYTDNTFRPNESISLIDCIKVVVSILGYDNVVENMGGYPDGYLKIARSKGLLNQISGTLSEPAQFGDVITSIYNALDQPMLIRKGYTDAMSFVEDESQTIRDTILTNKGHTLHYGAGTITANKDIWLLRPDTTMYDDQVEIDGVLYYEGNISVSRLIGQKIAFYYYEEKETGRRVLTNFTPLKTNNLFSVSSEDFLSMTSAKISYVTTSGKENDIELDANAFVLYNNRLVNDYHFSHPVFADKKGFIKTVDNDGDNKADYVFIEEYIDYLVSDIINEEVIRIKDKDEKLQSIIFKEDNKNAYRIEDKDGAEITVEDIQKDDVISVFKSKDDSFTVFTVSSMKEIGEVTEISDDDMTVGGKTYSVAGDYVKANAKVGNMVEIYINFNNKIAFAKESDGVETAEGYAFILGLEAKELGNKVLVKMVESGPIVFHEEENIVNLDDESKVPYTILRNNAVRTLRVAKRINLNGTMTKAENIMNFNFDGPIQYRLNDKEEIVKIDTQLQLIGGRQDAGIKYNALDKTFGGIYGLGSFAISHNTRVICLPEQSAKEEDYLVTVGIDNQDAQRRYYAQGYELNSDTHDVRLLVISGEPMDANSVTYVSPSASKIGIVISRSTVLNEDGEESIRFEILTSEGLSEYTAIEEKERNQSLFRVQTGDVIYYSEIEGNRIDNAVAAANVQDISVAYHSSPEKEGEQRAGYVTDVEYNLVDEIANRRIHKLNMEINGSKKDVQLNVRNTPPILVCNRTLREARNGNANDIIPGNGDMILCLMPYGNLRAVIVIKG